MKRILSILFIFLLGLLFYFKFSDLRNGASLRLQEIALLAESYAPNIDFFTSKRALMSENELLKKEIAHLQAIKLENLYLRADLKELGVYFDNHDKDKGQVILRLYPSLLPRVDTLSVKTTGDLKPGRYLLLSDNGYVVADMNIGDSEKQPTESFLLSARGRKIPAFIIKSDDTKQKITLQGKGYGAFVAQVNKDFKIKKDAPIYYMGIPIARVRSVKSSEQSPYITLHASVDVNLDNLDYLILKRI